MALNLAWEQVHAFRLKRHYLSHRHEGNPAAIAAAVSGIQAQLMASAEIALWTRSRYLERQQIRAALYEHRTLVKTSAIRNTLHLLPSLDFSIYITAVRTVRTKALMRLLARFGAGPREVDAMNRAVVDALRDGPLPQSELIARTRKKIHKKLDTWMELSWSVFRPAIMEGLICYGPERSRGITLVRVDQWLPEQKTVSEWEARRILFEGCLRAYGPATLQDCCRWSGLPISEGRPIWESLQDELTEVSVKDQRMWILHQDLDELAAAQFVTPVVRLLPHFDSYMLAHAHKDHLVPPAFYKKVYKNQGWLSPVVLVNGSVAGIWAYRRAGRKLAITVEPFRPLNRKIQTEISEEAQSLANFMELENAVMTIGS